MAAILDRIDLWDRRLDSVHRHQLAGVRATELSIVDRGDPFLPGGFLRGVRVFGCRVPI